MLREVEKRSWSVIWSRSFSAIGISVECWSNGVLEYWEREKSEKSHGHHYSITPIIRRGRFQRNSFFFGTDQVKYMENRRYVQVHSGTP